MVNQVGLSRKHIFDAVEASVKRLGTYIDVLQIHRLDRDVDREEIMKALNDVVERGWVRYIGASSVSVPSVLRFEEGDGDEKRERFSGRGRFWANVCRGGDRCTPGSSRRCRISRSSMAGCSL